MYIVLMFSDCIGGSCRRERWVPIRLTGPNGALGGQLCTHAHRGTLHRSSVSQF